MRNPPGAAHPIALILLLLFVGLVAATVSGVLTGPRQIWEYAALRQAIPVEREDLGVISWSSAQGELVEGSRAEVREALGCATTGELSLLNCVGQLGWELTTVSQAESDGSISSLYIFKRSRTEWLSPRD